MIAHVRKLPQVFQGWEEPPCHTPVFCFFCGSNAEWHAHDQELECLQCKQKVYVKERDYGDYYDL